jgi:hypothetical protein
MKCDLTNTVLTFVLGAFAVGGVIFAMQTIFLNREFRSLTFQATACNSYLLQAQSLANEVASYNQKYPSSELTRLLQATQTKPAAR